MASDAQTEICLDIAVDHRIRKLLKPVPRYATETSTHVSRLEQEGRSLQLPSAEIQVTAQLAGPPVKGGIAVMLQQPRNNHPFEQGLEAVIDDCETLRALEEIFSVVSCGTLNFREDITVVDLLPYVSGRPRDVDDTRLKSAFRTSNATICAKNPDVLLCAGRIMMPFARAKIVKENSYVLECIGIGERFGRKWPVEARIRNMEQRGFVHFLKVNGFHPSHAMNYHSHFSLLRQLLILVGAEACGRYREDWRGSEWMDGLRQRCQEYTSLTATPSTIPQMSMSPGRAETGPSSAKYLPEYAELYSKTLDDISESVGNFISTTQGYVDLRDSAISEKCNDANLILRQMLRLKERGWLESEVWKERKNKAALEQAAADTSQFTIGTYNFVKRPATKAATPPPQETPLATTLRQSLDSISECVTVGQPRKKIELDLHGAANGFLQLAVNIETLLLDLLCKKEAALQPQGQEDLLSEQLGGLTLGPGMGALRV
ncbi:hypothetical protein LZ31DRAFT_513884 [Colletotrichum somersetense]|nr:hypothetical protein LZ31DRAFT_513884 [Colletotrichum somersetense]